MSWETGVVERGESDSWLVSFRMLLTAISGLAFIAGGYPRVLLSPGAPEPEDIDIFFLREENVEEVEKILRSMYWYKTSETAAALNYGLRGGGGLPSLQLVKPTGLGRTGNVVDVLAQFDFSVNQYALTATRSGLVTYVMGEHTNVDQANKRLRIINVDHPLSLVYRIVKYVKKGYYLPRLETAKLFMAYDASSDALKGFVKDEVNRIEGEYDADEEAGSFEMLHLLTDGLIGEKELFAHV